MKEKLKKHSLLIILIALGVISLVLFLIGGAMSGWDIMAFLESKQAILIAVLLVLFVLFGVCFAILTKGDDKL